MIGMAPRYFRWKDTNLRVVCEAFESVTQGVMRHRRALESYIRLHPEFQSALVPVSIADGAPDVVRRMAAAAEKAGVGPMAAVAGTLAQMGAECAMAEHCNEVIVENGGDLYLFSREVVHVGLFAGNSAPDMALAFRIGPEDMPVAVCSSSATMGHSLSLGNGDLATVVSTDASVADAVATRVCNQLTRVGALGTVLEEACAIDGVRGVLAVMGGKMGMCGQLPQLVRHGDERVREKITRDPRSE